MHCSHSAMQSNCQCCGTFWMSRGCTKHQHRKLSSSLVLQHARRVYHIAPAHRGHRLSSGVRHTRQQAACGSAPLL